MPYAIVQTTLDPPTGEQLGAAFALLDQFTHHDGQLAAKDAYGVLINALSADDARTLAAALASQNVPVTVVDQSDIPPLPPPQRVRRIALADAALTAFDALGRSTVVSWNTVKLLAVGAVPQIELAKSADEFVLYDHGIFTLPGNHEAVARMTRFIDLIVQPAPGSAPASGSGGAAESAGDIARFQIDAAEFRYDYLGGRMFTDAMDNFRLLVGDLARHAAAAGAILNRGAHDTLGPTDTALAYPTRHSYEEEIRWLLWRAAAATA